HVDAIRESFLDDDSVSEVAFRLGKEVADCDGFAGTAHAEEDGVLWGEVRAGAGKGFDANEIVRGAFVDRLGGVQMAGERRAERERVPTRKRRNLALLLFNHS